MEENNFSDMTILVVEDEENAREFVAQSLSRRAKKVWTAANGVAGLQAFKAHQPDIVISDLMMPSMNGIEMVKLIREVEPMAQVILASAHNDTNSLLSAIDAGIDHYIIKPINMRKLFEVLARSARSVRQNRQVKKMQENIQIILDYQENIGLISFGFEDVRINIYLTKMTVATCLNHPKKGKTQLFIKKISKDMLEKIFEYPRKHTGKGYYKKN